MNVDNYRNKEERNKLLVISEPFFGKSIGYSTGYFSEIGIEIFNSN